MKVKWWVDGNEGGEEGIEQMWLFSSKGFSKWRRRDVILAFKCYFRGWYIPADFRALFKSFAYSQMRLQLDKK